MLFRAFTLFLYVFCCFAFFTCRRETPTLFKQLKPAETGVEFANTITERDTVNVLDMEFVYNGGGVAVGDLNGDGLEDLYFTGNQVGNKLYLNKGGMKFQDVTEAAGVQKKSEHQWSSGINILDINLDGRLDIYVCNTASPDPAMRRNLLFINQGNDGAGIPTFREMAAEYGIDDPDHASHAQFFDYDNDGDLDLFIGVNLIYQHYPNQYITLKSDGSDVTRDKLFRNDWNETLKHPVFTDVSLQAGIVWAGYSHSTLICDFNNDRRPDIYVANDYMSNDLLYLNNGDGTFTNRIAEIFKHQSLFSMGSDLGDIDNDGRPDIVTTEMQPYYNKRKKLFVGGTNYQHYLFTEQYKYQYQYNRNTLQCNSGIDPETGLPVFSEVGMYAGIQETDWSWSPLFADFDNDGLRDLYITNGFPRDITDHDFAEFNKSTASFSVSRSQLYNMIPQVMSPNFMFKNNGDRSFSDVSKSWGLAIPSFSNGSAYADLDNDGDLDLVTNNIDAPAFLFENQSNPLKSKDAAAFLRIKLEGPAKNPDAFGSKVEVFYGAQRQTAYILSGRGYLSKSENSAHFGLGVQTAVDSVVIAWPDKI
jgi:enediyne biosynthesis protein E4